MMRAAWRREMRRVQGARVARLLLGALLCAGAVACGGEDTAGAPAAPDAVPAAEAAPAPQPEAAAATPEPSTAQESAEPDVDGSGIADGQLPAGQPAEPEPDPESYWLLTEFDWGDDREVVYESTRFDPFYTCHRKFQGICALTQVRVGAEDLLAQFHFDGRDRLFQMVFLTPDLDRDQADTHLRRVWQKLVDYVTRHKGEPESAEELPDLASLELSVPRQTHLWRAPGLEVRVMLGRRDEALFWVGAFFSDPARQEAREAYIAGLPAADRMQRERSAERAARTGRRVPAEGAEPAPEAPAP